MLLRSDLIKSSSEERSLLKNLGSWLGKFTIGRNQALRAKEIDPKALIIEVKDNVYESMLILVLYNDICAWGWVVGAVCARLQCAHERCGCTCICACVLLLY